MIEIHSATLIGIAGLLLTILSGVVWMLWMQIGTKSRVDHIDGEIVRHERLLEINSAAHAGFMMATDCRHWQEIQSAAERTRFADIQRQLNEIKAAIDKLPRRLSDG